MPKLPFSLDFFAHAKGAALIRSRPFRQNRSAAKLRDAARAEGPSVPISEAEGRADPIIRLNPSLAYGEARPRGRESTERFNPSNRGLSASEASDPGQAEVHE